MLRLITLIMTLEGLCVLSMYGQPIFLKDQHLYVQQQEMINDAKGVSHLDLIDVGQQHDRMTAVPQGVKIIRVGKINLYQDKKEPAKWYASRVDQEMVELAHNVHNDQEESIKEFRTTLSELMSDREDLWWKIFELEYDLHQIADLIDEYNGVEARNESDRINGSLMHIGLVQSGIYTFSNNVPSGARQDFNYALNREIVMSHSRWPKAYTVHTGVRYHRAQYTRNLPPTTSKDGLSLNRSESAPQSGTHTEVTLSTPFYMRWYHRDRPISVIAELGGLIGYRTSMELTDDVNHTGHGFYKKVIFNGGVAFNLTDRLFVATTWGIDGIMIKTEARF